MVFGEVCEGVYCGLVFELFFGGYECLFMGVVFVCMLWFGGVGCVDID